jgi:hypothetical protein
MFHSYHNQLVSYHRWTQTLELHDFTENKHCFVAYDMLFLERSSGTHFCLFRFLKVRPMVVQLWKKLAPTISIRPMRNCFFKLRINWARLTEVCGQYYKSRSKTTLQQSVLNRHRRGHYGKPQTMTQAKIPPGLVLKTWSFSCTRFIKVLG